MQESSQPSESQVAQLTRGSRAVAFFKWTKPTNPQKPTPRKRPASGSPVGMVGLLSCVLLCSVLTGCGASASPPPRSSGSTPSFVATPLTDMGSRTYKGLTGGLYPNGNTVPPAQAAAGLARAGRVQPLDADGKPSPNGKIVLLSISMSNGSAEWCGATTCLSTTPSGQSFMVQAAASPAVNHQTLMIVNGSHGGQVAARWTSPSSPDYDVVRDQQLAPLGLTEKQVQVIWLKEADAYPTVALPARPGPQAANQVPDAYTLETELGNILRALRVRYPNLQEVFLSSRIYGGYASSPIKDVSRLNPEPYAYESGFSVKWVIQAQIEQMGNGGAVTDARAGDLNDNTVAPWIAWGPYLWADGTIRRSDGLVWLRSDFAPDGTHPSPSGIAKVGTALLNFFLDSPYTRCWFRAPAQHARCALSPEGVASR
jgi:hypothetical protein